MEWTHPLVKSGMLFSGLWHIHDREHLQPLSNNFVNTSFNWISKANLFFPLWGVLPPSKAPCILVGLLSLNKIAISALQKMWWLWVTGPSRSFQHSFSTQYFSLCLMSWSWRLIQLTPSLSLTLPESFFVPKRYHPGCTLSCYALATTSIMN